MSTHSKIDELDSREIPNPAYGVYRFLQVVMVDERPKLLKAVMVCFRPGFNGSVSLFRYRMPVLVGDKRKRN
jgi:hypothetical protein